MIRVLFMIAIAGFVLCIGTLSAAVAIGGPEAIARGGWSVASGRWGAWDWDWDRPHHHRDSRLTRTYGVETSRTLPWSGAESLEIELSADVRYIQQDGPGSVEITGPERSVEKVVIQGDSLRYDGEEHHRSKLKIVVRAPNVSSFDVSGRSSLAIEDYRQDRLKLEVSGSADVKASGEAKEIDLDMSGSSDADLGAVKAAGAKVTMTGAADAVLAPTDWAQVDISGRGDVRFLTRPGRLESEITGSGRISQGSSSTPPAKGDQL